jgi:hypothetical protein
MTPIELKCDTCGILRTLTSQEVEEFVAAFQQGNTERLRCLTCGTSLSRPLQRALDLPSAQPPQPPVIQSRRRHVRLPVDLPADYQRPDGEQGSGRVKNLSDGGLLLLAHEPLTPSTSLRLQLHAHHGDRSFEGVVVWNSAGPGAGKSSIAHGIRFTSPVTEGFAVELFLSESFPRRG